MSNNMALEKEFDKQMNEIQQPNIMVVGGTGVGKSSVINEVFGKEFSKVGAGEPVTKGCTKYSQPGTPISIFDTEGYEIIDGEANNGNFEKKVISEIERRNELELKEQIHLFWYCISISNHRITSYDIKNIMLLNKMNPDENLAIVFTQCDNDELDDSGNGKKSKAFKELLVSKGIKNPCFETMIVHDDTLELKNLINWSAENLPKESFKQSFIGAQKNNISIKHSEAANIIKLASVAAAVAAGANPFPMSDSLTLIPIQMGMAIKLTNIYGLTNTMNTALSLFKSQVVSMLGKQAAASLLKLIPGVGQLVNAGVASTITFALGYALKEIYTAAYVHLLDTGEDPDWQTLFTKIDLSNWLASRKEPLLN